MRNIAMVVSYDGTAYSGFQIQPHVRTVQGQLENGIKKLTGETINIIGSGRTDAGVHAYGQVINFITTSVIPVQRWVLALNSRLPKDIVIRSAWEAPLSFHARYSSNQKTYRYSILAQCKPDVFRRHTECFHPKPLNVQAMQTAITYFVGEHDFTSFTALQSTKRSNIRTIYKAYIEYEPNNSKEVGHGRIHLLFTGNGFLYNMIRIMVGTLIRVGEGKLLPCNILHILAAKNRQLAGPLAMAHGLTLWNVVYGAEECLHVK